MAPDIIHIVFKTHLDLGFTDQAEAVRRLYHERFIPQALATAEHFWREDPAEPKFVWTTGAWLIHDHLATGTPAQVDRLERAIERGLIRWHGLPFTTHSELMSPALFCAGLSFSAELDRRFGVTTRAAKMTDVPGHTLGIVPLMAKAGLRFLHVGVNSASPVPEVPEVFLWRAPDGSEIIVMVQASYGDTHCPAGMTEALSFAHTEDNIGPQSVPQVAQALRGFARSHPKARLRAATLEDYGALLWDRRETLPVVTAEIGDSWIHGTASDPQKLARFRALQRLYDTFEAEGPMDGRLAFGRALTLVAEHTWGVDIKSYLRDESAWDRTALEVARAHDPRFAFSEASWTEQRAYLHAAVAHLGETDRKRAEAMLAPLATPARIGVVPTSADHAVGEWRVRIDAATGDILRLRPPGGPAVSGRDQGLLSFRHLSFDAADVERHLDSYLSLRPEWAILDHGKPGLERAATASSAMAVPTLQGAARDGDTLVVRATLPAEAHAMRGAPAEVEWRLTEGAEGLGLMIVIRGKPASRLPEAGVVDLTPKGATGWELLKTGLWIDPAQSARRGGGALHAAFAARSRIAGREFLVTPLDTALIGAAGTDFMRFDAEPPDYSAGLRLNLYNNKWGTNFPQWWEGDLVARLTLALRSRD